MSDPFGPRMVEKLDAMIREFDEMEHPERTLARVRWLHRVSPYVPPDTIYVMRNLPIKLSSEFESVEWPRPLGDPDLLVVSARELSREEIAGAIVLFEKKEKAHV